jgi:hypothetical protein
LFSQVLRLPTAEGIVSLGMLSLDGAEVRTGELRGGEVHTPNVVFRILAQNE